MDEEDMRRAEEIARKLAQERSEALRAEREAQQEQERQKRENGN